ncbi:glutamate racemase [Helicobacter sp. MIT 03-1614]|jgi:glutamate racemase|uniref:Glutamate racemase n=1 Tax=Helicobacter hepaticus (strain ATCC 51449 / 3B1) TaxID=235279 RepID=Q7VK68_HELHP|nr:MULTISPECIES: glutamate racemase [Helicobacter]AAP76621.1 glutamate racemase [Helicobacter hepaticus ATCC 51449]TLD88528.1 glutamate racemase [Helicobacter sp. MIT 03-1614]
MRAGVFDSGVGGLSVLKSLINAKLFEDIIYYGDTARVPYGVKDKQTIIKFSLQALEFFTPHNIDILIVACNTVSAYALQEMQKHSKIPIVGVIEPGVLAVQNNLKDTDSEILIIATRATINSGEYETRLRNIGFWNLKSLATGLFVPIVEEGLLEGAVLESVFHHYFASITTPPQAVILGCTHFPLIAPALDSYFNHQSMLIHSGEAIVEYLKNHLHLTSRYALKSLQFFASDNTAALTKIANKWLS